MSDPYQTLGISPSASDEEVKTAYRRLAKKYHPDKYVNSPLADLAGEKMKEINEAYDQIMKERREHKNGASGSFYGGYAGGRSAGSSDYADVRNMIYSGRIADAEQILDGVPPERRNAEWYFLKGTILYRRGWLEEAFSDISRACQMTRAIRNIRWRLRRFPARGAVRSAGTTPMFRSTANARGATSAPHCVWRIFAAIARAQGCIPAAEPKGPFEKCDSGAR